MYVDPASVIADDSDVLNLSKWYRYDGGKSVPSPALIDQVSRRVPGLKFRVRHPVFACLRDGELSESHRRRLRAEMPSHWHQALKDLRKAGTERFRLGRDLVALANLGRLDFLDALYLFSEQLTAARKEKDHEREGAIITVLYVLPLLYCDDIAIQLADAAKAFGAQSSLERFLLALDEGLALREGAGKAIQFPVFERCVAISLMYEWVLEFSRDNAYRRRAHVRRRFLASQLELQRGIPIAFGLVPCRPPGRGGAFGPTFYRPPVDERVWAWAWHTRAKNCRPWVASELEVQSMWKQLGKLGQRLKW